VRADILDHPVQAQAATARLPDRLLSNLCAHRTAASPCDPARCCLSGRTACLRAAKLLLGRRQPFMPRHDALLAAYGGNLFCTLRKRRLAKPCVNRKETATSVAWQE
jgi:hypothetical protein